MRRGVRLGVDVGSVRIGVARSDVDATLAVPVETVPAGQGAAARIAELVTEYEAIEVLVGMPLSLSGEPTRAAQSASDFAAQVAQLTGSVPVLLVDERLSTTQAHRQFRSAGKTTRQSRSVVDQAAAVIILEHALDTERRTGQPCGTTVGKQ